MGYYGGNGARKVATVTPSADAAADPAGLPERRDAPAWSTAATGPCRRRGRCRPTPCRASTSPSSCATDGTGGASHIVFVVRDDASHSDLLFQTSDTTWQAYNDYGGNSLYDGAGTAGRPRLQGQLQPPVQHARPTSAEDFVFNAEYPMVRWLEANGYDVSYYDRRRHRPARRADPATTRVPVGRPRRVLVGRPARQRRGGPRRRRQPGVLQRQRGLLEDPLGDQHRRLRHAVPHAGHLQGDRTPTPRSTRRPDLDRHLARPALQPAGRRRPARERADRHDVHGQRRRRNDVDHGPGRRRQRCGSGATPASRPRRRRDGDARRPARSATSGTRTSTTASARPGLIELSPRPPTTSSPEQAARLRLDVRPGTATHSLTLYRAAERRAGLRRRHGPVVLGPRRRSTTDAATPRPIRDMQQATVNLLADMGAQPATLQAGLVAATASTDTTAPTSTITSPAAGAHRRASARRSRSPAPRPTPAAASSAASRSRPTAARPGTRPPGDQLVDATPGRRRAPARSRSRAARVDDSGNIETPGAGVTVNVGGRDLPVQHLARHAAPANAERHRHERRRARRQVPRRRRPARSPASASTRAAGNTGTHVGQPLDAPSGTLLRPATFTGETATGWQQVTFASAGRRHGQHDLRRLLLRAQRPLRRRRRLLQRRPASTARRCTRCAAASTAPTASAATSGTFPTNTYADSNYWVDVVFTLR